ncbi:MAG: pyridoxal phosphate-dependent aminotransferase [Bacteroidales bacterium]|nr:pyridoxal phosphate-dependent aminotransferase [Bacteroidales bacterium]
MKIKKSGARFSAIVGIGEKIKQLSKETGKEYLYLNRGINAVCPIDLSQVVQNIDFNSDTIQVYPPNSGMFELKEAISKVFFDNKTIPGNITITAGGMSGLDLIFQTLDIKTIYLPSYYWGAYAHILKIRNKEYEVYQSFKELSGNVENIKDAAVIICDPNNPLGDKHADVNILELVRKLNDSGTVVVFDSPYRRVFYDDSDKMHQELLKLDQVIIVESFSKSVGLSGQRLGFVHSVNKEFNEEFGIRILYINNGVNAFAQQLVYQLLTSKEGKKAVEDFKRKTIHDIELNIQFLKKHKLLAEKFYKESVPKGIFVIVNKTEEELLDNYIGSVSLSFFTRDNKNEASKYSRICVSVPHEKFIRFLKPFIR